MQALARAADHGVKVRIYLDDTQFAEREPSKVFHYLAETPGVEIKTKHKPAAPTLSNRWQAPSHRSRVFGQVVGSMLAALSGFSSSSTALRDDQPLIRLSDQGLFDFNFAQGENILGCVF